MMKIVVYVLLLAALIGLGEVRAHSNHGAINGQTALNIASKSTKQLTFRDFGFEVGKLDASWTELQKGNFSVVEVLESSYIIRAENIAKEKTIFFQIANDGQVLKVKNVMEF